MLRALRRSALVRVAVRPWGRFLYGVPMASVREFQVTFDCAEPERVARFWCEVLWARDCTSSAFQKAR